MLVVCDLVNVLGSWIFFNYGGFMILMKLVFFEGVVFDFNSCYV